MRAIPLTLCLMAALPAVPFATSADAASFDCGKAERADEVAICRNPELSALDSEMGGLWFAYRSLPFLMGMSGIRQDEAQRFLEERRTCGAETGCLREAYLRRIAALKKEVEDGVANLNGTQPADAAGMPSGVAATIASYADQCDKLGGNLAAGADRPNVMTGDVDGDGIADYVLDTQSLQCNGAATAFCGNGGCQVDLVLSGAEFRPTTMLGGQPTLTQYQNEATVSLWVSGANCAGLQADQSCWLTAKWADGKLDQRYEARARPN